MRLKRDSFQNPLRKEVRKMDEERRNKVAYQLLKLYTRRNLSFRDIGNIKREIGNLVKEPELLEANISKDELLEFRKLIAREVFEGQMTGL